MRPGDRVTVACVDLDDDGAGAHAQADLRGCRGCTSRARCRASASRLSVVHVSPHAPEAWARLDAVEAPSPARRAPACRRVRRCGGCVLQHYAYDAQLAWKQARVARALAQRSGRDGRRRASRRRGRSATATDRSWWRRAPTAGWCWAPTRRARTTSSTPRAAASPSRRSTTPRPRWRRCSTAPASPPTTNGR